MIVIDASFPPFLIWMLVVQQSPSCTHHHILRMSSVYFSRNCSQLPWLSIIDNCDLWHMILQKNMEYKTQTIQNETYLCNETGQHCETAKPAENKSSLFSQVKLGLSEIRVIDNSDHCNTGSFFSSILSIYYYYAYIHSPNIVISKWFRILFCS